MSNSILEGLTHRSKSKIVLLVMDGLGGLPLESGSKTELEQADTPNLDRLACEAVCGLHEPVAPGITPGSGPSHLALFGYDPIQYQVGRGVLSALGIDFPLEDGDIAARGNFCTLDNDGKVLDRRAGRIDTETNERLCNMLSHMDLNGVRSIVRTVKEHRFVLVLRGDDLSHEISDTDPQQTGVEPLEATALSEQALRSAELAQKFVTRAQDILKREKAANGVLLRGFSKRPNWLTLDKRFALNAAGIAGYPMYRGVAKLVGMTAFESGESPGDAVATLEQIWDDFDFFFVHAKKTDSAGEDGDFERKVKLIEQVDGVVPRLLELKPDVIIVTGDHSTPSTLKSHSWHTVPVLLRSRYCRADSVSRFGERACLTGGLGPRFPTRELLPLALANALRIDKFGA